MEQKYTHEQIKVMKIIKRIDEVVVFNEFMMKYPSKSCYEYFDGVDTGLKVCKQALMEEYELEEKDLL